MRGFRRSVSTFLKLYDQNVVKLEEAALAARRYVEKIVGETNLPVHLVSSRVKNRDSIIRKIRAKGYSRPQSQVTDLIGVRVTTFYQDNVDPIATTLKQNLRVVKRHSVDKRGQLGLREFGYRSVHLLARLPSRELRSPEGKVLKNRLFEIQIRSLLEHAWAEFEHAIVYKSGINFPKDIKRTFSQLAGALELLDGNFLALRDQSDALVEKYVQELKARTFGWNRPLDVATLVAALEYERPSGYGWRLARQRNQPFIPGTEVSALQALRRVNIRTLAGLHAALRARRLQQRIIKYAGAKTIPPEQVAHWVVVALVVGLRKPDTLRNFFPELLTDPEIVRTLA